MEIAGAVRAGSDAQLIELWLHGRGVNTQRAYRRAAAELLGFASCELHAVTLGMQQAWVDGEHMQTLAAASRGRGIAAIKCLR
jgi:integrase/recombinase XerD